MGTLPVIAALLAALNVLWSFAGLHFLEVPFFLLTVLLAGFGFAMPGEEKPGNGRTLSGFAILIAALPFVRPSIDAFVLAQREKARTAETAPQYKAFDNAVATLEPQLLGFYREHGVFPAFDNARALPAFRPDGTRIELGGAAPISPPADPFDNSRSLEIHAVGQLGALVVSVGQDGVPEYPWPRFTLAIDAQPNDPLALFAATGTDLRLRTYDPTNGSLSTGDLVAWVGNDGIERKDAFARLDDAWDTVNRLTPLTAKGNEPKAYAPEDDAKTAALLAKDAEHLAVLAAASRVLQNRRPHPNFWTTEDIFRADSYRGYALFQLGHSRSAADAYIDYLAYRPNDPEAHYWLGISMFLGGDKQLALRHLGAAFQIGPTHPIAPAAAELFDTIRADRPPTLPQRAIFTNPAILWKPEQLQENQSSMVE